MMMISVIVALRPENAGLARADLYQATHAWFLDRIGARDHRLNERLHQPHIEKPYTISNLLSQQRPRRGQVQLHPDRLCGIRITSYAPDLSAFLLQDFLPSLPAEVVLDGVRFQRAGIIAETADAPVPAWRPWVGSISYEDLWRRVSHLADLPDRFTLRFASPTLFHSRGQMLPLPLPRLIFEGLARRWNRYAPLSMHPDLRTFSERYILLEGLHLRDQVVHYRKGNEPGGRFHGFMGTCTFRFGRHERYWQERIIALAVFARYAGLGRNTARGMGQCLLSDPRL